MESITQILEQFGVEWPKFIAQVILFLLVYIILNKFAFAPVIALLEERRRRIEESEANAEKIRKQLAEAEVRYQQILTEANDRAQKLIDEAKESGLILSEKKKQEAISEASRIIAKAQEAMQLEHEKMASELRRDLGRLVIDTTSKVAGKVLTSDDQKRLSEETARQVAS